MAIEQKRLKNIPNLARKGLKISKKISFFLIIRHIIYDQKNKTKKEDSSAAIIQIQEDKNYEGEFKHK